MDLFRSLHGEGKRSAAQRIYHKPQLSELLRLLGVDVVFHRAAGDLVYYHDERGNEIEVLDVVGGYGTLLFGHAHPMLTAEAIRILSSRPANHAQGSMRARANALAAELSRRAEGDYCVVFANSGAEAVEAAMKHALLQTGGETFLALEGAFHGKTLGAVQLSGNDTYREPFACRAWDVIRVAPNDEASLEAAFQSTKRLAGFLFEPIQGEAGVRPLDASFLQRAAELCARRGIPLIADECQTGFGRTGSFLASRALDVRPDMVVLSKALGGGIAKIAAVLIDRRRYVPSFDWLHTSTYADDEFSSGVAHKALELLTPDVLEACRAKGAWLLARLEELRTRYPQALASVRGTGLMIGVELRNCFPPASVLLRQLAAHRYLGLTAASYLLHAHRIRAAPTLSDPFTIRIQPSALISPAQLERIVTAFEDLCRRLQDNDVAGLTRFLTSTADEPGRMVALPNDVAEAIAHDPITFERRQRRPAARRVAWLFHMASEGDLKHFDSSCAAIASDELKAQAYRFAPFCRPVFMNPVDVCSATGSTARLFPILLPVTARWINEQLESRNRAALQSLVELGIDAAERLGCSIASLGQLTSSITRQGRTLAHRSIGLTTGNSYTAALAVRAVDQAMHARNLDPASLVLAVVGAAGNIGRVCVEMLSPRFCRTLVLGSARRGSWSRLQGLADQHPRVERATLAALHRAHVVICATSSIDPIVCPNQLAPGTIVCDLSVPHAVNSEQGHAHSIQLIEGGIARLPGGEAIDIPGFPLPACHAYGCLAEGLLLAFEDVRDQSHTGTLTANNVQRLEQIALRHGFEVAMNADRFDRSRESTSTKEQAHVGGSR